MALPMITKHRIFSLRRLHALYVTFKSLHSLGSVRVRFAPSPTGMLHLGGLRTALFNYLFARANNGSFILRIEDTDQTRFVPGAIEKLETILDWVGLTPDEGPSVGGSCGPYLQSRRVQLYQENVEKLIESGHCYRCFCTVKRLELLRKDQARRGETVKYDNKCRGLTDKEVQEKVEQNIPYVIRFKYDCVDLQWQDMVFGEMKAGQHETEGDFVVIKSDSYPTYHFANVVDDHHMEITHVLRGEEWQVSTPKHLQMYAAFGWQPPLYAHLPLILNKDGTKLSKRQDDIRVEYFRDKGYEPEAVLNYVTTVGSGFFETTAGRTLAEMVSLFSVKRLNRQSGRLEPLKLEVLNRTHLQRQIKQDKSKLIDRVRNLVKSRYKDLLRDSVAQERILSDSFIDKVLTWSLNEQRIFHLKDLFNKDLEFVWLLPSDEQLRNTIKLPFDCAEVIKETRYKIDLIDSLKFSDDNVKEVLSCYCKENKLNMKQYMALMRNCLGGAKEGPPVAEMITILGKEETLKRLKYARETLSLPS